MKKHCFLILQVLLFLGLSAEAAENHDRYLKIIFSGAIYGELEPCG